ncbi:hypothetical protein MKW94_014199 [Papaver nudicaule]|uniref:Nucleoplasmin-like domain-containing protein n=1 Tax=Papaver nudicaule TaxID=74823 RepID=A0AA42ARF6_PAPNU|nr:hypothetical protein [Papaver nudicaule]
MTIWGLQLYRRESPFTHCFDKAKGKLRISQATIGGRTCPTGDSNSHVVQVWCEVQHSESPILLCSISPHEGHMSIPINFEFGEDDGEVVFSVSGENYSVYLAGYFLGNAGPNVPTTTDLLL